MNDIGVAENIVHFSVNNIDVLKEYFATEINSKRRLEAITSVEELHTVLKDRNVLTEDTLLILKPNLKSSVETTCKNLFYPKGIDMPITVVKLINENCTCNLKKLGAHLGLSEKQLHSCLTFEKILWTFQNACTGTSPHEMIFKLTSALEKCGKGNLKPKIFELIKSNLLY